MLLEKIFFQKYFQPYLTVTDKKQSYGSPNTLTYLIYTANDDLSGSTNWFWNNGNNAKWTELPDGSAILFNYSSTGVHATYGTFTVILASARNKKKLIVGKDVFAFTMRKQGNNNTIISPYNYQDWSCPHIDKYRTDFLKACRGETISSSGIPSTSYCTSLIYCNDWKIPEDYSIRF